MVLKVTNANDAALAKKLVKKTNPSSFTIKLLNRKRTSATIATIADRSGLRDR